MTVGPVEYLVVSFPGNDFTGDILPALADLIGERLIRVLDLVFILKDEFGDTASFEFDQLDEFDGYEHVTGEARGLLTSEDIAHAANTLEPNSSAALLLWEDLWAGAFAEALRTSNGYIVEGGRVPHDLIEAAFGELPELAPRNGKAT